jgi:sugar lactone lactonase YvrE
MTARVFFLLLSATVAVGCRTTPWAGFPTRIDPTLVWPPPPAAPRVAFVQEIRRHTDLFRAAGFWRSVAAAVAGPADSTLIRPYALALHPSGGLLVADPGRHVVHFFSWKERRYFALGPKRKGGGLASPVGVAALPDASVLVSDSQLGCIERFDPRGKWLGTFAPWGTLGRPAGLAVDAARGEVYAADVTSHTIVVFSLTGQRLRTIGKRGSKPGELNFPTHLTLGPEGRLYATDSMNFRVQEFDSGGKPLATFGRPGDAPGAFAKPKGVAVDSQGNCIVVEGLHDVLTFFDSQGRLLLTVGGPGPARGEFCLAAGLALDREQRLLFVADSFNSRVQVFRLLEGGGAKTP